MLVFDPSLKCQRLTAVNERGCLKLGFSLVVFTRWLPELSSLLPSIVLLPCPRSPACQFVVSLTVPSEVHNRPVIWTKRGRRVNLGLQRRLYLYLSSWSLLGEVFTSHYPDIISLGYTLERIFTLYWYCIKRRELYSLAEYYQHQNHMCSLPDPAPPVASILTFICN